MNQAFLGIDISKKTFDVALLVKNDVKAKKFNNNKQGFLKLLTWINNKEIILSQACMESTGTYGEALANFLYSNDVPISVVNPARIKGFSQSELTRNKNDILDAKIIGRFCKLMKPKLWKPTPEKIRVLQQWIKRLDDLIAMQIMEENRLEVADYCLKVDIKKHIKSLKNQIKKAEEMIKNHIKKHEDLKNKSDLIQSIPGVGGATAPKVLSFLYDISKFKNAKEVAAFLGLNPRQRQSGSSVNGRTRLSKTGDSALRKAFYMPAVVAMRHNPILKEFKDRLEKAGKCKMVIIGAVMRKLVHIIYGVLKNKTAFNENILKLA
jgi:transposase